MPSGFQTADAHIVVELLIGGFRPACLPVTGQPVLPVRRAKELCACTRQGTSKAWHDYSIYTVVCQYNFAEKL